MTLYLIRHGSAGVRNGADPHDADRHLDEKGTRQARRIVDHLGEVDLTEVYSSPLPRCVETVQPLADRLGLEVLLDRRLGEGAALEQAWELLEEVATHDVALCSHGDVIPELVAREQRRGMRVVEPTGFAKGSVWALRDWNGTHHYKGTWNKLR